MSAIKTFFADLRRDEDGASFVEYSVLIGIIIVAGVASVILVGGWASTQWSNLVAALPGAAPAAP